MANLQWKTPFEMLYGHVPSIDKLSVIGCLCYAANIGEKNKFEARASRCVLLGYTFGFKGYKLYGLDTKKVFHSRDVIFQEHIFPFKTHVPPTHHDSSVSSFIWPHSDMSHMDSGSFVVPPSFEHVSLSDNLDTDNHVSDSLHSSSELQLHAQVSPPEVMVSSQSLGPQGSPEVQHLDIRKSTQSRAAPRWLKHFVQPKASRSQQDSSHSHSFNSVAHPFLQATDLAHLSQDFVTSLLSVMQMPEPYTYSQAKESLEWTSAMDKELEALEANGTWKLTTLPPHKRALTSKWIYKAKFRPDGSIERYKAWLVIRGFQ